MYVLGGGGGGGGVKKDKDKSGDIQSDVDLTSSMSVSSSYNRFSIIDSRMKIHTEVTSLYKTVWKHEKCFLLLKFIMFLLSKYFLRSYNKVANLGEGPAGELDRSQVDLSHVKANI